MLHTQLLGITQKPPASFSYICSTEIDLWRARFIENSLDQFLENSLSMSYITFSHRSKSFFGLWSVAYGWVKTPVRHAYSGSDNLTGLPYLP